MNFEIMKKYTFICKSNKSLSNNNFRCSKPPVRHDYIVHRRNATMPNEAGIRKFDVLKCTFPKRLNFVFGNGRHKHSSPSVLPYQFCHDIGNWSGHVRPKNKSKPCVHSSVVFVLFKVIWKHVFVGVRMTCRSIVLLSLRCILQLLC